MNENEELKKRISHGFSLWEVRLKNLGVLRLFDAHSISEDSICDILNLIFRLKLVNLNSLKMGFAAIDLGDIDSATSIQVSATRTGKKVQETLDSFSASELHKSYSKLLIVILGQKQKTYKSLKVQDNIKFDSACDIIDFQDLLKLACALPVVQQRKIAARLEKENTPHSTPKRKSEKVNIREKLKIKKKIEKGLLRKLSGNEVVQSIRHLPIKFECDKLFFRSIHDKQWGKPPKDQRDDERLWFIAEIWDLTEDGIELYWRGPDVVINEQGYWDEIDDDSSIEDYDSRCRVEYCMIYAIVPYESILEVDFDTEYEFGQPTFFMDYHKGDTPYKDMLIGTYGGTRSRAGRTHFYEDMRRPIKKSPKSKILNEEAK